MVRDMTRRVSLTRIDNKARQSKVIAARRLIYEKQYRIDSAAVERLLKHESLVPTAVSRASYTESLHTDTFCDQNAFSEKLSRFGFNVFDIFVVDIMHDWELGGARALLIHLLRILDAKNGNLLMELDRR
jgi:hypothetical protein